MDNKIIKKLAELESKAGKKIEGLFIFNEAVGKITVHGQEYDRKQWEDICRENPKIITIFDNIAGGEK